MKFDNQLIKYLGKPLFRTGMVLLIIALAVLSCSKISRTLPAGSPDNGGLFLPDKFEALVVVDSIGKARHLAVNDNGDIYVKLTFNRAMKGSGGTVRLRDLNKDGRADSIVYFGDYKDIGGSAVGMTIHDGYLYTSTVNQVLKTKLTPGKLVPESKTEVVLTDLDPNVATHHLHVPYLIDPHHHHHHHLFVGSCYCAHHEKN